MSKKYKWETPDSWLLDKLSAEEFVLSDILPLFFEVVTADDIQDHFQREMDEDGYFEKHPEDIKTKKFLIYVYEDDKDCPDLLMVTVEDLRAFIVEDDCTIDIYELDESLEDGVAILGTFVPEQGLKIMPTVNNSLEDYEEYLNE
jgi:hypothetical protein